ncbi:MAG: succinate dehydrogenase iron-sulfur subunit, partial [candidate division GAL15 bacterium]
AHRFIFDSRDRAAPERLAIVAERSGAFKCRTVFNCTDACPQGIEITKAIQDLKRAVVLSRA